jgi:hypothetical protein
MAGTCERLLQTWLRDAVGDCRERAERAQAEADRAASHDYGNACQRLADAHRAAAKAYQEAAHACASGS